MMPTQMVSLVEAAFRRLCRIDLIDAVVVTFRVLGRHSDVTTVAWIGCLLVGDEMETLMGLQAAWRRGEDRSPAEAARSTIMAKA